MPSSAAGVSVLWAAVEVISFASAYASAAGYGPLLSCSAGAVEAAR